MQFTTMFTVLLMVNAPALSGDADAGPMSDRAVFDALKELNNRGADLNNAGDSIGCYRLYQGGLHLLRSLASHRPAVQKAIEDGLKAAERKPIPERAFALHTTITELRAMVKPTTPAPANPAAPVPGGELPKPNPIPATNPPASFPGG